MRRCPAAAPAGLLFAALLALVLSGCAGPRTRSDASPPQTPLTMALQDLQRWNAKGRIAVSAASESGGSGSFEWRQEPNRAQVQIRGPVGIGSLDLELAGDAEHPELTIRSGAAEPLHSQAALDELQARLGAEIPVGQLRYWMLGTAAPGEHRWQDQEGSRVLEQGGWRIEYPQFIEHRGVRVPARIRASGGEANVRIVIDRWQLGE